MNNRDMYNSWVYLAVNIDIGVFVCFDNRIYNRALKWDLAKGNNNLTKGKTYKFWMVVRCVTKV
jgi:hypothetical protein